MNLYLLFRLKLMEKQETRSQTFLSIVSLTSLKNPDAKLLVSWSMIMLKKHWN